MFSAICFYLFLENTNHAVSKINVEEFLFKDQGKFVKNGFTHVIGFKKKWARNLDFSFQRNFNSQLQPSYFRIETFNHAESTDDVQKKQARNYEFEFTAL